MNPTKFPVIYQATVAAVVVFLLLMFLINQGVIPLDVSGLLTYYSFQVPFASKRYSFYEV